MLVKQIGHFADHIVIDVAVAGESFGAFAVAGELADEVLLSNTGTDNSLSINDL